MQDAKVKKYIIAPDSAYTEFKRKFATEPGTILKTLKVGLSSPTYTRITEELTTIEIHTDNVMIIQIFNKAVAKGYREHFDLLWAQARRYDSKESRG